VFGLWAKENHVELQGRKLLKSEVDKNEGALIVHFLSGVNRIVYNIELFTSTTIFFARETDKISESHDQKLTGWARSNPSTPASLPALKNNSLAVRGNG
jgi:hypothetical protein